MSIEKYRYLFSSDEWEIVSELQLVTAEKIAVGKLNLCNEKGVDNPKDMKYIGGHQHQLHHISKEARLLQYNVMQIGHQLQKSTVAFKSGWGK